MALEEYRRKRNFRKTKEPRGVVRRSDGARTFVVQKHAARTLHYDFRLELDGVLKSWAVPKGPSENPHDKRLAVQVEDHPLSYADFEGEIPAGEYGAGSVELWDRGTWEPHTPPQQGLERGKLSFTLHGERLEGEWSLVRMKGRRSDQWLLIRSESVDTPSPAPRARKGQRRARAVRAGAGREVIVADVPLTNPDKELFPHTALTKQRLAMYFETVADEMLRDIADRPLTLVRCPRGGLQQCFFQRHANASTPEALGRILDEEERQTLLTIRSVEQLVTLAQLGTLEIHCWGARKDRLDRPDRLVLDLDPGPEVPHPALIGAVRTVRDLLKEVGLEGFLRTTGGKGFHVVIPIDRTVGWEVLGECARHIADALVLRDPELFTNRARKKGRAAKVYLDYLRNTRGASAIANFSTRAKEGAPVAMPLEWGELRQDVHPSQFTLESAAVRAKRRPWRSYSSTRQRLTKSLRSALAELAEGCCPPR